MKETQDNSPIKDINLDTELMCKKVTRNQTKVSFVTGSPNTS